MIDFGDFIKSQRGNVGFPRRKKINEINLSSPSIADAKAKVQRILDDGSKKRKKRSSSCEN